MNWKKMIGGRQFWSLMAVLLILLGVVLIVGHPKEEAHTAPLPPPEDDVKVLVLNYHMVNSMFISLAVEPEDFDWQMKYLVDHGYHTISIDELYDFLAGQGTLPDRPVLITFDDGYVDNYTNAYPILKKYNLKATIFIVTGFVSKRRGYLTWDQLREMEKNGIMAQSHTVTHAPLPELSDERIREELVESKRQAETELGHPVEFIAYPTGAHDLHIVGIAKEAGYKGGFTVKYGNVDRNSNVYAMERVPIFRTAATNADFVDRLRYTSNITQYGWIRN
ncbi:polysaccharide deacetylase [Selenomonas sp. oral taxon 920]|uniref:polysaccharide deacetylase family protein n=1 Tax=Selenomonas sp. oral taxon 920 TaxID=1884263 RepID=UPI000840E3F4|nr:polysaccharide deacetylase family protein [Selenomonas sp. oral taxon 920]AOH48281.1 polysaccharide deacetylase [Selenomonas sp. oral taxon 920]